MGTETLIMIKHETPCSSRVLMNHKRAQARVECAAEVASSSSSAFSSPIFNAFAFVRCLPPSKAVSAVRSASASSSVVSRRPRPSASRRFVRYYCFTASGCFVALWRRISSHPLFSSLLPQLILSLFCQIPIPDSRLRRSRRRRCLFPS